MANEAINEAISALGPVFGPDFIEIVVNDETNKQYHLQVYPDSANGLLKANGMPTQYYFMPQRVYLAKKQDAPEDFDFGMTIFKGLMTTESTIGITNANTSSGTAETGGGFCTFSTTFAIPDSVIANAIEKLKSKDYPEPPSRIRALFNFEQGAPQPVLGIVPILENTVTVEVPALQGVGNANLPFFINAQGAGKGSIEPSGISSFLVTCNELAAGAIGGSLKKGQAPFTVHYNLKQQFYINACDVHVIIDVDKVFEEFSAAASAGGLFGQDSYSLSLHFQNCVTTGAIKTIMHMNNELVPQDLKEWILLRVKDIQGAAYDQIKEAIFDWKPSEEGPATATRGLASSLLGGGSLSLKANYQHRGIKLESDLTLDGTYATYDTVSGDLTDLESAIKAKLDKYFAVVDIGDFFSKLQIAATNNINWSEKLSDGTDLRDPIVSAQVEVSYPNYSQPLGEDNQPNLETRASGFHYTFGQSNPNRAGELAVWTADNPHDIINISFLRLEKSIAKWDPDQVKIRKTLVFDGSDPRVELATGGTTFIKEEPPTNNHTPIITADEVGYVFVKFMLDRILPKDNITLTLTCTLGQRKDTITVTRENQKNILWEIFSDKYIKETSFQYKLQVEVIGPNFTDEPVTYEAEPVTAPFPTGRVKYINPLKLVLPPPPPDKLEVINAYIKNYSPS